MNEYTREKTEALMGILIHLGLDQEQVCGVCSMMHTEQMVYDVVDRLKERDFKLTPQEAMNICAEVIKENL